MVKRTNSRTKIRPEHKAGEAPGINRHWRALFLDYLAESSNVTQSAEKAGVNPSRAYKVRREDPEFAQQWLDALWEGYEHLEMEVLGRLRQIDTDGAPQSKYDFANAIRLLNAHRDNAARAQAQQRNVSAADVRASIDRKVEEIRKRVNAEKKREAAKG